MKQKICPKCKIICEKEQYICPYCFFNFLANVPYSKKTRFRPKKEKMNRKKLGKREKPENE